MVRCISMGTARLEIPASRASSGHFLGSSFKQYNHQVAFSGNRWAPGSIWKLWGPWPEHPRASSHIRSGLRCLILTISISAYPDTAAQEAADKSLPLEVYTVRPDATNKKASTSTLTCRVYTRAHQEIRTGIYSVSCILSCAIIKVEFDQY